MLVKDWRAEVSRQGASPALDAVFSRSAVALCRGIEPVTVRATAEWLNDAQSEIPGTGTVVEHIVRCAVQEPPAAKPLLAHANGLHRVPFALIASEALNVGDRDQQSTAVELLQEVFEETGLAEAAAARAFPRSLAPLSLSERRRWLRLAEERWPPSVRGFGRDSATVLSFGIHYLRHLLAAALEGSG